MLSLRSSTFIPPTAAFQIKPVLAVSKSRKPLASDPTLQPSVLPSQLDALALADPANLPLSSRIHTRPMLASRVAREAFAAQVLPPRIQDAVNNPFGKDNLQQSFVSEAAFRHVLLPLFRSCFLGARPVRKLKAIYKPAAHLYQMLRNYAHINFLPLRDYAHQSLSDEDLMPELSKMTTACFFHFDFDTAAVVRWLGGVHTNGHRNSRHTLGTLAQAVDPSILHDLERIFTVGVPALCNAEATETNFKAAFRYGNHKTVYEDVSKTKKAITKEARKGYVLVLDPWLSYFIPHLHRTPIGIINLQSNYKKLRVIFDASFRPHPASYAINDWTNKSNEPPIHFQTSFLKHCVWLWNMRITYPHTEIHPCDDDVAGAFRWNKYNPNLVAMHSYMLFGYLFMATGTTFGDNSSPKNWEPIARA